jgi:uncharacterized protein (TIGR02145 family)
MRKLLLTTATVAATICLTGCSNKLVKEPISATHDTQFTLTDERDGKKYRTIAIGGRMWMAQNLNYLPQSGRSWCYNDSNTYCDKYGRLYNWEAAKSVCPAGWRLPSPQEWEDLVTASGGGFEASDKLRAKSGWGEDFADWEIVGDDGGFAAMPGGSHEYRSDEFNGLGYFGYWWSAAEDGNAPYYRGINYCGDDYLTDTTPNDDFGISVRCIQDESKEQKEQRLREAARKKEEEEQRIRNEEQRKKEEEQRRLEMLSTYFTDPRDGRKYRAVEIGGRRWMAENLNYQPQSGKSWCYGDDGSNCDKYGKLYDWETATAVCPAGWHLPSRVEWGELGQAVGGERKTFYNGTVDWYGAVGKLKSKAAGMDGNGSDDYGFSALPGGKRHDPGMGFTRIGYFGSWWTASERETSKAYNHYIFYNNNADNNMMEYFTDKSNGLSVRCVQDESEEREQLRKEEAQRMVKEERRRIETEQRSMEKERKRLEKISTYVTDPRDKRKYRTVKIGSYRWMAENLNYKADSSWCFDNDNSNCDKYGRLYDWKTAKSVCPSGWHLPTADEWDSLTLAAGGANEHYWHGSGKKLKTINDWSGHNDSSGNGTDDFGFSALPGGFRDYKDRGYYVERDCGDSTSIFIGANLISYWWTATAQTSDGNPNWINFRRIRYDIDHVEGDVTKSVYGFYVRCVANK